MNYKQVAENILKHVGGKENISGLEHCSTRLRFSLVDDSIVDQGVLESVDGVLKVIINSQCQVVIGNEVNEVYDEILTLLGGEVKNTNTSGAKKKPIDVVLDYLISIFQPLVPAIAGAGILKSILLVAAMTPLLDAEGSTYQVMMNAADAALYFLPVLVAFTTAKKLRVNELVAVTIVSMTILPNMLALIGEGTSLLGFGVENISYPYQVFPAILIVFAYSPIERFFTKISPKPIRIFFVSMMSILVMTPIALLILGPLGFYIGEIITAFILALYGNFGWVAVAILAALLPLMVSAGMHKALAPYAISSVGTTGYELLYLPASLAHNISEAGMCFAVALKTKNEDKRSTAISAGISASCGITEPALYGVTLQSKQCMSAVVMGSLISGTFIGLSAIKAFTVVGPGIPSMTMFVDQTDPSNFIKAVIAFIIALASTFIITLFIYKEPEEVIESDLVNANVTLDSSLNGKPIILEEVNDEIFSSKVMGDGFAVSPETGVIKAPAAGQVEMVFETNHALGLKLENGAELLIHIGIDTVSIEEKVFDSLIKVGDKIGKGQDLVNFNLERIKELGYDPTTMFIVTNSQEYDTLSNGNAHIVKRKEQYVK